MKPHFHSYICRHSVYKGIFVVYVMEHSLVGSYSRLYSIKSPPFSLVTSASLVCDVAIRDNVRSRVRVGQCVSASERLTF
jgi:hypothetical protein